MSEYTGRIIWNDAAKCWETPSSDVAGFLGTAEHPVAERTVIAALVRTDRRSRKAKAVERLPDATMWRTAPEYRGDRKVRTVQPIAIFAPGIAYMRASMLKPYTGFADIEEALAKGAPSHNDQRRDAAPDSDAELEATHSKEIRPVPIAGELRIRDYDLGVRLGYPRPTKIRELINAHKPALLRMGALPTKGNGLLGGAAADEFYLNRKQAIFINAKSDTELATDLTIEVIHKFDAYENGGIHKINLQQVIVSEMQAQIQPIMAKLQAMEEQNGVLVANVKAQSEMLTTMASLKTGRRTTMADLVTALKTALTPVIMHGTEVGSAKSMNVALTQHTPIVGNMIGNAVWAAAKAIQDGTVDQKMAERKAKRKARRGDSAEPPPAEDDPAFDFDFDG